jgi:hypothetical protein
MFAPLSNMAIFGKDNYKRSGRKVAAATPHDRSREAFPQKRKTYMIFGANEISAPKVSATAYMVYLRA